MAMRFEFDPAVNALYVRFNEGQVDRTVEVDDSMNPASARSDRWMHRDYRRLPDPIAE